MHGCNTAHPAIFIDCHRKMHASFLHPFAKHIRLHVFRHKVRFSQAFFQNSFFRQAFRPLHSEKITNIHNADDVVAVFTTDRHVIMPAVCNRFLPVGKRIFRVEHHDIGSVRAKLLNRNIVEIKHILNHLVFFGIDYTFFTSCRNHHANFFFRYGLVLLRIDADKLKDEVCGSRQKPYQRLKHNWHDGQNTGNWQCNLFGFVHRDPLRNQLSEDDAEICNDNGNYKNADGIQYCRWSRYTHFNQFFHQRLCEIIRSIGTSQKSRQSNCHLYCCKESGRLRG